MSLRVLNIVATTTGLLGVLATLVFFLPARPDDLDLLLMAIPLCFLGIVLSLVCLKAAGERKRALIALMLNLVGVLGAAVVFTFRLALGSI